MNRRTLGIIAGVIGSAVSTWWFMRQRTAQSNARQSNAARNRGTVIFHNTPTVVDPQVLDV